MDNEKFFESVKCVCENCIYRGVGNTCEFCPVTKTIEEIKEES